MNYPKILALVALSVFCRSLYAGLPNNWFSIPNQANRFEFTVEGLLLQPSNNDLDYGVVIDNSGNTNTQTLDPSYDWGFRIGTGYIFANSGKDIQIAWTHFNQNYFASETPANIAAYQTTFGLLLTPINPINDFQDSSDVQFKYDAIDLDIGQYLAMGTYLQFRLFGGLRFIKLQNNITDTLSFVVRDEDPPTDVLGTQNLYSKFNGGGPRLGMGATYQLIHGISITGLVDGMLLMGNVQDSSDILLIGAAEGTSDTKSFINGNQPKNTESRFVPGFDVKLGLNYSYVFKNASMVILGTGYQLTRYINVIDRVIPQYTPAEDETIVQSGVVTTTSNVEFQGPYFSLTWKS